MEAIASRQNPIVKTCRALARGGRDAQVLLEGRRLVEDAVAAGVPVRLVAVSARLLDREDPAVGRLLATLEAAGVRVVSATPAVMAAMSPVRTPSGVVAIAERTSAPPERVFAGDAPLVFVLAGLQDPGNVGAVIRAADAAGATGIVACEDTADPFGWKALRGAMGSTFRVPIATGLPVERAVTLARRHGLAVLAATPHRGRLLYETDLRRPVAVVLGGEGGGLPEAVAALADAHLSIPMRPPVDSLNVAVSAALVAYEVYRQRRHGSAAHAERSLRG
jgi:TrmH family RNA methyltransferase